MISLHVDQFGFSSLGQPQNCFFPWCLGCSGPEPGRILHLAHQSILAVSTNIRALLIALSKQKCFPLLSQESERLEPGVRSPEIPVRLKMTSTLALTSIRISLCFIFLKYGQIKLSGLYWSRKRLFQKKLQHSFACCLVSF